MIRAAYAILLVLAGANVVQAAEETPPAGTWKVLLPFSENGDRPRWLVKLEQKDGKWIGSILDGARGEVAGTLANVRVTKESLRFSIQSTDQTSSYTFRLPANKTAKLYGSWQLGASGIPAELHQTTVTSLAPIELLKESLVAEKDNAMVLRLTIRLLGLAGESKAKPEEVRSWAARAVKTAEVYGPSWHRQILLLVAEALGNQKGYASIALTYARQAERLLDDKDRPAIRKRVLDALASVLTKAGKSDEAKEVEARIKKIDFTIKTTPFAGRKGKSDRVVLVELFTAAEHPPCVAADLACDALGKTFKSSEVVRLHYHLHIPGPDPLANRDDEARVRYYRRVIEDIPAVLIDGGPRSIKGGDVTAAWGYYDDLVGYVRAMLGRPARAKLKATVTRKGAKISILVNVSEVQGDGDELRLRVALVEEQVAYTGANKLAMHVNVVRAFAGGPEGEKVAKDKAFTKTLTVDLDEVRKGLREELDKRAKDTPFPNKERPLDLKKLRVIVFVQNDSTHEVLQAHQVDVPAE